MRTWIISANGKMYDHAASFAARGFIDWRQVDKRDFNVGDTVYIYNSKQSNPPKRIRYKTVIERINMRYSEIVDDKEYWYDLSKYYEGMKDNRYFRLRLIEVIDEPGLSYENLRENGLTTNLPGPYEAKGELLAYINSILEDDDQLSTIENDVIDYDEEAPVFPETDIPDDAYEGAKKQVFVNKYERSAEARRKCIEYHGCKCAVCGMVFGERYGEIGEGFIHVHHLKPLSEINQEYKVNYKTDLVPVCPNCHAMLHRKINGEYPNVEELREMME